MYHQRREEAAAAARHAAVEEAARRRAEQERLRQSFAEVGALGKVQGDRPAGQACLQCSHLQLVHRGQAGHLQQHP